MSKEVVRFWIGSNTSRISSEWKIWGKNGQVYLTCSNWRGRKKLSIHDSGENQFGFTPEARRKFNLPNTISDFPSFVRWKRKSPGHGIIVPVASLQFPTDYLKGGFPVASTTSTKPKSFIEPAPPGQCVEMILMVIRNSQNDQKLDCKGPFNVFLQLPLGDKETCLVGLRNIPFDIGLLPDLNNIRIPDAWLSALNGGPPKEGWIPASITLWSQPNDYGAIGIGEISGFHMKENSDGKPESEQ